jgi:hypothetical protein
MRKTTASRHARVINVLVKDGVKPSDFAAEIKKRGGMDDILESVPKKRTTATADADRRRLDQVKLSRGEERFSGAFAWGRYVRVEGAIGVMELGGINNFEALKRRFVEKGAWVRSFGRVIYMAHALTMPV